MTDSPYNRVRGIFWILAIAVPVSLFVALKWLRGPTNVFLNLSGVACQIQEDCDRQLAGLQRAQSELDSPHSQRDDRVNAACSRTLVLVFIVYANSYPEVDEVPASNVPRREPRCLLSAMVSCCKIAIALIDPQVERGGLTAPRLASFLTPRRMVLGSHLRLAFRRIRLYRHSRRFAPDESACTSDRTLSPFLFPPFVLNHGWDRALPVKTSASTVIPSRDSPSEV